MKKILVATLFIVAFSVVAQDDPPKSPWRDRDSVRQMFDIETDKAMTALEKSIDAFTLDPKGPSVYELIEKELFPRTYGLNAPEKLESIREQLTAEFGADSNQVKAWDAGIAQFKKAADAAERVEP